MAWYFTALKILIACLIPNIGGFIGSLFSNTDSDSWYGELNKPSFNPPNWVFFPAWTTLYILMGYSSYRVWHEGGGFDGKAKIPLIFYAIQLILNWLWTPIFFNIQSILGAFIEMCFLWVFVVITTYLFYKIDKLAGILLLPYIAWITFAATLNFALWNLN